MKVRYLPTKTFGDSLRILGPHHFPPNFHDPIYHYQASACADWVGRGGMLLRTEQRGWAESSQHCHVSEPQRVSARAPSNFSWLIRTAAGSQDTMPTVPRIPASRSWYWKLRDFFADRSCSECICKNYLDNTQRYVLQARASVFPHYSSFIFWGSQSIKRRYSVWSTLNLLICAYVFWWILVQKEGSRHWYF